MEVKKNKDLYILKEYVEGKRSINEVKQAIIENENFKQLLKVGFDYQYTAYLPYKNNIYNYLTKEFPLSSNWNTIRCRAVVYMECCRFLNAFKIKYDDRYTKYEEDYEYLLDIQPVWLNLNSDTNIVDKIVEEIPQDLSKTEQIAYGKQKLNELFQYDTTYPKWIQAPEWPIINGKPLVFREQSIEKTFDERVYYTFYDPDTKEETVIMQMY